MGEIYLDIPIVVLQSEDFVSRLIKEINRYDNEQLQDIRES